KVARIHYIVALVVFCLISASLSAFINDSAVVAILIPLALSVCRETKIAPSRLLIPISFAALFGGTCTLIGTSTNILVSSIAQKSGLEPFGMFEFTLPALLLLGIGLIYLFVVAPFLLPKRHLEEDINIIKTENYITELVLKKGNKDINKPLFKSDLVMNFDAQVMTIVRSGRSINTFDPETTLLEDDILKVAISSRKLNELKEATLYEISGNKELSQKPENGKIIFETMVPVGSLLAGTSLKKIRFRNIYKASVLAIRKRNELIQENISDVNIKEGDLLLLYATREELNAILQQNNLILLSEHKEAKINYRKAIPALLIAFGVVMAAALNITSI